MFQLPDIEYFQIEAILASVFLLALLTLHLWRTIKAELRSRKCVFCDEQFPADEYTHHLEICGLKRLSKAQQSPQRS